MIQPSAVGSIEIREKLATRETGELYLGYQPAIDRMVVLCKLRRDLLSSPRVVERFRREARLGARIVHPNVVSVFDLFASRGDHYLVLEHVDGPSLREILEWRRPMRVDIVARIALELARALAEVHDRGVVHADVRPEHVWVGRWGEVKLGGFGLAWETREAEPPAPPPSSRYAAPSAGAASAPSARGDVYSLGVVLSELLDRDEVRSGTTARMRSRLERALLRLIERCSSEQAVRRPAAAELVTRLERLQPRLSAGETRAEIAAWLVDARRGESPVPEPEQPAAPRRGRPQMPRSLQRLGLLAGAFVLLGLGASRLYSPLLPEPAATPPVDAGIAQTRALVRFAVHPWAEIQVDDATPFLTPRAEPVELAPGRHHVVFRHPRLGRSERELVVEPGAQLVVRQAFEGAKLP